MFRVASRRIQRSESQRSFKPCNSTQLLPPARRECGLTLQSTGRPQAGFAHLRPPVTSNVRALRARPRIVMPRKVEQSLWAAGEPVDAGAESLLSPPVVSTRLNSMSSRVRSQAALRHVRSLSSGATHLLASGRLQCQSVIGAPRRRAAPGNQSVNLRRCHASATHKFLHEARWRILVVSEAVRRSST